MSAKHKRLLGISLSVIFTLAVFWIFSDRSPVYQGHTIKEWTRVALRLEPVPADAPEMKNADAVVLEIGAPAVPYLARYDFHDRSHVFTFLSYERLEIFRAHHPSLKRWFANPDFCLERHLETAAILAHMGPSAHAAAPDIVDCIEHCPELHCINDWALVDTLGDISVGHPENLPGFERIARADTCASLLAAYRAYEAFGETNLLVKTFSRWADRRPEDLLGANELYRAEQDTNLTKLLQPVYVALLRCPQITPEQRAGLNSHLTR